MILAACSLEVYLGSGTWFYSSSCVATLHKARPQQNSCNLYHLSHAKQLHLQKKETPVFAVHNVSFVIIFVMLQRSTYAITTSYLPFSTIFPQTTIQYPSNPTYPYIK